MSTLALTNAIFKFQSHTYARDKIFRLFQYGSRFAVWYLNRHLTGGELAEKLQSLESTLALSRKLFRMGNSFELAQRALAAMAIRDQMLRASAVTAHGLKSLWLLLDHVIWFAKVGLVKIDITKWNNWASWSWLIGIAGSAVFHLLKLSQLQTKLDGLTLQMETVGRYDLADDLKVEMHTLRLGFWRDLCDLFIPLSSLQFINPGLGAFSGIVSSVIGFQMEWEKHIEPYKAR